MAIMKLLVFVVLCFAQKLAVVADATTKEAGLGEAEFQDLMAARSNNPNSLLRGGGGEGQRDLLKPPTSTELLCGDAGLRCKGRTIKCCNADTCPSCQKDDGSECPACKEDVGGVVKCGSTTTCAPGEVCCNASCGICTEPGGFCIQLACGDEEGP